VNVDVRRLTPGVFGVSHGSGLGGEIIRHATGSWAGHAFLYLGGGQMVEGAPPEARIVHADKYGDAIWAWRMWDQLKAGSPAFWTDQEIRATQDKVVGRGHALVGCGYDWPAYAGFSLEILNLRNEQQLSPFFTHDGYRVCSALVDDAEVFGGVPMNFVPADGPGHVLSPEIPVAMPANLVAPGMLLGLMQRSEWI
jgi:hypothetical protein